MSVTKEQFIRGLAEAKGTTIKDARKSVNDVLDYIVEVVPTLGHGEKLDLTGVIQIEVTDVPTRTRRNPQTGEEVQVEASRKAKVRPMSTLKQALQA